MKFITLAISCIIYLASSAQVEIINRSLTDSSIGVIYIGVENRIVLKTQIPEYRLAVAVFNGDIRRTKEYEYIWKITAINNSAFIVYDKENVIGKKTFKPDSVPQPAIKIASEEDSTTTVNGLLLNPYIQIVLPDCYLRNPYSITSFDATFIHNGQSLRTKSSTNSFSSDQIKTIKQLVAGDKICFSEIRMSGNDSRNQKLPSFSITIKE